MKTLIGLSLAVLLAVPAFAQTPIADIKYVDGDCVSPYVGMQVTVRGIVKNLDELGTSGPCVIEDDTGGILFYDYPIVDFFAVGDDVTVTAWLDQYNGLLELVDEPDVGTPPTVVINSSGNPTDPNIVAPNEAMSETWEGSLLRCDCVFFHDADGVTMFNYTHTFEDAYDNIGVVYEDSSTDLGTMVIPYGWVDVIGVGGQYDSDDTDGLCQGYQMMPRGTQDIIFGASPTEKTSWSSVKELYR